MSIAITAVSTLLAAFLGAWFAFQLNERREQRKLRNARKSAVNRGLYAISRMWNNVRMYQKEVIGPAQKSPAPWLSMQATVTANYGEVYFPIEELAFMLDDENADLYARLLLEEQRYQLAIAMITEISKITGDELYPKMEALGYRRGQKVNGREVAERLGPALTQKLSDLTSSIITHVDEDIKSLTSIFGEFRVAMTTYFEGEKLVDVEFELQKRRAT